MVFLSDLCSAICQTQSIISGSFALHHILRSSSLYKWMPNNLDIYVSVTVGWTIIDYLLSPIEGYLLVASYKLFSSSIYEDLLASICSIIHMLHPIKKTKIDIIISTHLLSLLPIVYFWSTLVINMFSANLFTIVYPYLILASQGCVACVRQSEPRV